MKPINRNQRINSILQKYGKLLSQVDRWFAAVQKRYPKDVVCKKGCYDCCLGLFDISLLDAYYLQQGFSQLPKSMQKKVINRAEKILIEVQKVQPNLTSPYYLTELSDADIDCICNTFAETRCPLLSDRNQCLVYPYRPMTCRLHGIPLIDVKHGIYFDQWCELNFVGRKAESLTDIAYNFTELDKRELQLFVALTETVFAKPIYEIYLFIPAALVPANVL
ncbi:MAG: YkgJ family cysteine cluster protein [bacterium]|nr:YkgJ family cysteine cluster protein [bacterium]